MGIISTMGSKRIIRRTAGSGLNIIHRGRRQPSLRIIHGKRAVRGTSFKLSVIWGWWPSLHVRVHIVDCVPLWGKGGWCACLVVSDLVRRQNEHIVDFCGWWRTDVLVVKMLAASVQTDVSVNGYLTLLLTALPGSMLWTESFLLPFSITFYLITEHSRKFVIMISYQPYSSCTVAQKSVPMFACFSLKSITPNRI